MSLPRVPKTNVSDYHPSLGLDAEFFFASKSGDVISSGNILDENGIGVKGDNHVERDGVQVEIQPMPSTCRETLHNNVKNCFKNLLPVLEKHNVSIIEDEYVELSDNEFKRLDKEAKVFGCMPDNNVYTQKENKIEVDASKTKIRTAGGHIHMGCALYNYIRDGKKVYIINDDGNTETYYDSLGYRNLKHKTLNVKIKTIHELKKYEELPHEIKCSLYGYYNKDFSVVEKYLKRHGFNEHRDIIKTEPLLYPEMIIPLFDLFVANTWVLLNKNPKAKERRKIYGKAGDFRYTKYGLEYRTLSNVWLKHPAIYSFTMAAARLAYNVVRDKLNHKNNYYDIFMEIVDPTLTINAINENDYDLSLSIYETIKPYLISASTVPSNDYSSINYYAYSKPAVKILDEIIAGDINKVFNRTLITNWVTSTFGSDSGWGSYVENNS